MNRVLLRCARSIALPAVLVTGAPQAVGAHASAGPVCRESGVSLDLPVGDFAPGPSATATTPLAGRQIFVRFCQPASKPSSTVQVLVHGITYDHRYWNVPDPDGGDKYSREAAAARAGYATPAIDRLGAGRSSHPPSVRVDMNTGVAAVRALIHARRAGAVPGPVPDVPVRKVVVVGHSYGSMTSWFVASRNPDVDAVLLTGATHHIREFRSPLVVSEPLYPAVADPAYSGSGLDPGYLTDRPGTRYATYYAPDSNVDQRVLANDEATKGTVTFSELNNYPAIFRTPVDIRVPVLLLIGTRAGIFCSLAAGDLGAPCDDAGKLVASEAPFLGPAVPSLRAQLIYGAGHALNAVGTAPQTFAAAQSRVRRTVGPGS
jgi:pimeloyl-ACP methyl ester carboxylesterase